jgi:hypothetical protein
MMPSSPKKRVGVPASAPTSVLSHNRASDIETLKRELVRHAEQVCHHLLPSGKRAGGAWLCGNLMGDEGRSLSVNLATGIWCDFATGQSGSNLLELWRQVRGLQFASTLREASAFCGVSSNPHVSAVEDKIKQRARWPKFEIGGHKDLLRVAILRAIALEGIELASTRGLLRFANWRNHPCWIITDSQRMIAQARRMDGEPFAIGSDQCKTITLPGSYAGIPIGLNESREFSTVVIVEGGPDLLAAHACMWAEDRTDVAAVAVLGAGQRPITAIWSVFKEKRVRVYCHRDSAGMKAGRAWNRSLVAAEAAKVDGFKFDGLRKFDDSPVNDLNDLLLLHCDDFEARHDVWEVLP